jgi:hypothetical protein
VPGDELAVDLAGGRELLARLVERLAEGEGLLVRRLEVCSKGLDGV